MTKPKKKNWAKEWKSRPTIGSKQSEKHWKLGTQMRNGRQDGSLQNSNELKMNRNVERRWKLGRSRNEPKMQEFEEKMNRLGSKAPRTKSWRYSKTDGTVGQEKFQLYNGGVFSVNMEQCRKTNRPGKFWRVQRKLESSLRKRDNFKKLITYNVLLCVESKERPSSMSFGPFF